MALKSSSKCTSCTCVLFLLPLHTSDTRGCVLSAQNTHFLCKHLLFILSFLLVLSGQQVVNQPANKTVSSPACHPSILQSSHSSPCRNLLYLPLLLSIICALFIFTPPLFHSLLWPLALAAPTSLNVARRQTGEAMERSFGQTDST